MEYKFSRLVPKLKPEIFGKKNLDATIQLEMVLLCIK